MPNILNDLGIQVKTRQELLNEISSELRTIYGSDIVLDSDTPDGQFLNIFVTAIVDVLELIVEVYNSFDPDNAIGKILDQRVAINGIQRQGGTHTTTNVNVTFDRAVTLTGLNDVTVESDAFTVADNAGNEWYLISTYNAPGAETAILTFRASVPGRQLAIPNEIQTINTIILGVTSVNNPTPPNVIGIPEESDYDLKIRRQRSVSLSSQGYLAGLLAAIENVSGVVSAYVYENRTGAPDGQSVSATYPDGTPSHCIWVVVDGSADPADIAQAIYIKRNAGANMRGDYTFAITQTDGSPFQVRWDYASLQDLFIKFNVTSLNGVQPVNYTAIKQMLPEIFVPRVYEQVNINDLATAVQEIDNNCLVTQSGFSLDPAGSFDPVLQPSTRDKKFIILPENIIILPIIVSPSVVQVLMGENRQFQSFGGYDKTYPEWDSGTTYQNGDKVDFEGFTYESIQDGNLNNPTTDGFWWQASGAYWGLTSFIGSTIDPQTGLYTAGNSPGTDTITYTDDLGNSATATVTVI